jgi:hypothetical protein
MIIYAVQITILKAESERWLKFMQQKHIKEVMATGCFISFQLLKQTDYTDAHYERFLANYTSASMNDLQQYLDKHADALREDVISRFPNQFKAERKIYAEL